MVLENVQGNRKTRIQRANFDINEKKKAHWTLQQQRETQ